MATQINQRVEDKISYITFYEENSNKPCTLDWDVLKELDDILDNISKDIENYIAIVIESESHKSFIVGANIDVLRTLNAENIIDWVENGHKIFNKLLEMPIPVIAKVENYALGGGLELAMACDMIISTENAKFGQPEASLGVMPGWGGSFRLKNLVGANRAKEMFFTGKIIDAKLAYEWGIVNHVVADSEIDLFVKTLLSQISANDKKALMLIKKIINNEIQKEADMNCLNEAATSSVCLSSESTLTRLNNFFNIRKKK